MKGLRRFPSSEGLSCLSIVAQTPSHRDESADVFVHDAATLSLRSSRSCYVLYVLTTIKALPRQLEFLGIENLGASVTLLLRSCHSGYVPTALMLRYRRLSSRRLRHALHDSTLISLFARALYYSQRQSHV